jgi:hypothetical protein
MIEWDHELHATGSCAGPGQEARLLRNARQAISARPTPSVGAAGEVNGRIVARSSMGLEPSGALGHWQSVGGFAYSGASTRGHGVAARSSDPSQLFSRIGGCLAGRFSVLLGR